MLTCLIYQYILQVYNQIQNNKIKNFRIPLHKFIKNGLYNFYVQNIILLFIFIDLNDLYKILVVKFQIYCIIIY